MHQGEARAFGDVADELFTEFGALGLTLLAGSPPKTYSILTDSSEMTPPIESHNQLPNANSRDRGMPPTSMEESTYYDTVEPIYDKTMNPPTFSPQRVLERLPPDIKIDNCTKIEPECGIGWFYSWRTAVPSGENHFLLQTWGGRFFEGWSKRIVFVNPSAHNGSQKRTVMVLLETTSSLKAFKLMTVLSDLEMVKDFNALALWDEALLRTKVAARSNKY